MAKAKKQSVLKPSMPPIFELAIDDVKPYENNPRFNEEAVPAVAESLKEFGWRQPIVVSTRQGNEIVVGHTRVAAAKSLGLKSVPCIDASDLTDEQIKAYRLADNKTNELATWDDIKLDEELDALPMYDMKRFGFNYNGEANDEIAALYDDDAESGEDGEYKDCDKITIKIPSEHLDRVRKWMSDGGRAKVIKFVLVESGCIAEGDEVEDDDAAQD